MIEPERIDGSVYQAYRYRGGSIQPSDQPGYENGWFLFRHHRPYRTWVQLPDGSPITFGSLADAAAWLDENLVDASDAA